MDTDFREILWSITFLYRENSSRNKIVVARCQREFIAISILLVPTTFLSTTRNWILRSLHIYIYITIRETPIKMQWKFVSNVVCLIAKFPFFSVSCNMPFRITEILFPFFYNILFLLFHHCAFLKLFFLFFSLFFGILFIAKNFLILTILPVFHVVELLLNRIAKE